jgi:hypothetical protein
LCTTLASPGAAPGQESPTFCHAFDLTKRLESSTIQGSLRAKPIGGSGSLPPQSDFKRFLADIASSIRTSPPSTIHRIVVPNLLSPTIYPPSACRPQEVLQFLHGLRGLLRRFPSQATAMLSLPVSLYPRGAGLTRWAELLSDGVLELITGAQAGTIETGKTVKELLELTVGYAASASEERNVGYAYGEQPTVKKTDTPALILGVLAIVAPWVLKALGFPDEKADTVPGKYHDDPFHKYFEQILMML